MKARFTRGVRPLQTEGIRAGRWTARTVWTALLLTLSMGAQAQDVSTDGEAIPKDYYRAELVVLERIVEPEAVNEKMAKREVEPSEESGEILKVVGQDGTAETTLDLVPQSELHLNSAVQRLERSGRYRVLVAAGWYEAFPPGYEGAPLRVAVGDWLNDGQAREIEGNITIDRQRYLHVGVHLNHWQPVADAMPAEMTAEPADNAPAQTVEDGVIEGAIEGEAEVAGTEFGEPAAEPMVAAAPLELLTWIRETRRMRSEEIHFLDSPTVGVLVFFKKIEASE